MILSHLVLLIASFFGGIIAAFASGGTFLVFPALMLSGLDARAANIAMTLAMYPMQVSNGFAGRKTAAGTPNLSFQELFIISLIGGVIGAVLLLMTPVISFARLVPYLILFATLSFALGSIHKRAVPTEAYKDHHDRLGRIGAGFIQLLISIYGGYFGGGIGFLMLATLTYAGMNIRQGITTKNVLAAVMNTSAVGVFLLSSHIPWVRVGLVAVASVAGGLVGVQMIDKINERYLCIGIIALGLMLTIALFWQAH